MTQGDKPLDGFVQIVSVRASVFCRYPVQKGTVYGSGSRLAGRWVTGHHPSIGSVLFHVQDSVLGWPIAMPLYMDAAAARKWTFIGYFDYLSEIHDHDPIRDMPDHT